MALNPDPIFEVRDRMAALKARTNPLPGLIVLPTQLRFRYPPDRPTREGTLHLHAQVHGGVQRDRIARL